MTLTSCWPEAIAAISVIALVGCGGGGLTDPMRDAVIDGLEVDRRTSTAPTGWVQVGADNTMCKNYKYCMVTVESAQACADHANSKGDIFFQFNGDKTKNCATFSHNDNPKTSSGWTVYRKEAIWPQVGTTKMLCAEGRNYWQNFVVNSQMECQEAAVTGGYPHYNYDARRKKCAMCERAFNRYHVSQWRIFSLTAILTTTSTTTTIPDFDPFVGSWSFDMRRTPTFGTRYKLVTYEVQSTGQVAVTGSDGPQDSGQLISTEHPGCEGLPCARVNRLWGGPGIGFDLLIREDEHLRVKHYFRGHSQCCDCAQPTAFCCEVQSLPQNGQGSNTGQATAGVEQTAAGWLQVGDDNKVCTRKEACFTFDVGSTQDCADIADSSGDIFFQYNAAMKSCAIASHCDAPKVWNGAKIHRKEGVWPQVGTVGMICAEGSNFDQRFVVTSQLECQEAAVAGGHPHYNFDDRQKMCAMCDKEFSRYDTPKIQLNWRIFSLTATITTTTTTTNDAGILPAYCPFAGTWSWNFDIGGFKPTYVIDGFGKVTAEGTDRASTAQLLLNSNHRGCEGKSPCARVNRLWAGPGHPFDILILEDGHLRLKHYFYPTKTTCNDKPQETLCCEFVSSHPESVPSGCAASSGPSIP